MKHVTDVEYGNCYAIYLTDMGERFLTNPTSIKIMELLEYKAMTAVELSENLKIQKTTIQSNLKKLMRLCMITQYVATDDKRIRYYESKAILQFTPYLSKIFIKELETLDIMSIFNIDSTKISDKTVYFNKMRMFILETAKKGVDAGPILIRGGRIVAFGNRAHYQNLSKENAIIEINEYLKLCDIHQVHVTFQGESDICITCKHRTVNKCIWYYSPMAATGYTMEAISQTTGTRYCIKERYGDSENEYVILTKYSEYEHKECMSSLTYLNEKAESMPMSVYWTGEKSVLVGNRTMLEILEALNEEPQTLKQLSSILKAPPVTIYSNLCKLVDENVLKADGEEGSKFSRYYLSSEKILCTRKRNCSILKKVSTEYREESFDPENFFKSIFNYMMCATVYEGLDISRIIYHTGVSLANTYNYQYPKTSAMEFIDLVTSHNIGMKLKMELEEFIPLTFRIHAPTLTDEEIDFMTPFFYGLIKQSLKNITGDSYTIYFKQ